MDTAFLPSATFDLHLHTTRSDGRHGVDEVLERCLRAGFAAVALTDHDLPPEEETRVLERDGRRMWVLAAAELSGVFEGTEQHLLAYFPTTVPVAFRDFCRAQCQERAERYERARAHLPADLPPADDVARSGARSLTRTHLARALVRGGHARDVREAFARWLGDAHGRVPPLSVTFEQAISVARAHGALTSWAHPPTGLVDRWLARFVDAGLQGLEGHRPQLASDDRRRLRKAAERHGLYLTGGSDWHGWGDDADLGLFRVEQQQIRPFLGHIRAATAARVAPASHVG